MPGGGRRAIPDGRTKLRGIAAVTLSTWRGCCGLATLGGRPLHPRRRLRARGVVLRDIAHDERKSITDLINEGLDHVLAKRNYPGTADLRRKK